MGLKLISCDIKSVHRVFDHNEICLFTKNENLPVVQSLLGHPLKKKDRNGMIVNSLLCLHVILAY